MGHVKAGQKKQGQLIGITYRISPNIATTWLCAPVISMEHAGRISSIPLSSTLRLSLACIYTHSASWFGQSIFEGSRASLDLTEGGRVRGWAEGGWRVGTTGRVGPDHAGPWRSREGRWRSCWGVSGRTGTRCGLHVKQTEEARIGNRPCGDKGGGGGRTWEARMMVTLDAGCWRWTRKGWPFPWSQRTVLK